MKGTEASKLREGLEFGLWFAGLVDWVPVRGFRSSFLCQGFELHVMF